VTDTPPPSGKKHQPHSISFGTCMSLPKTSQSKPPSSTDIVYIAGGLHSHPTQHRTGHGPFPGLGVDQWVVTCLYFSPQFCAPFPPHAFFSATLFPSLSIDSLYLIFQPFAYLTQILSQPGFPARSTLRALFLGTGRPLFW